MAPLTPFEMSLLRIGDEMTPKPRKYTNIRVCTSINCSSTGHYTTRIHYDVRAGEGRTQRISSWYSLETASELPAYVISEIEQQLQAMHTAGEIKVFEYDQDMNERWDNLRYHEPIHLAYLIAQPEREARVAALLTKRFPAGSDGPTHDQIVDAYQDVDMGLDLDLPEPEIDMPDMPECHWCGEELKDDEVYHSKVLGLRICKWCHAAQDR